MYELLRQYAEAQLAQSAESATQTRRRHAVYYTDLPHTYAMVQGAGHDIHLDQPEVFVRELTQFLAAMQITGSGN